MQVEIEDLKGAMRKDGSIGDTRSAKPQPTAIITYYLYGNKRSANQELSHEE